MEKIYSVSLQSDMDSHIRHWIPGMVDFLICTDYEYHSFKSLRSAKKISNDPPDILFFNVESNSDVDFLINVRKQTVRTMTYLMVLSNRLVNPRLYVHPYINPNELFLNEENTSVMKQRCRKLIQFVGKEKQKEYDGIPCRNAKNYYDQRIVNINEIEAIVCSGKTLTLLSPAISGEYEISLNCSLNQICKITNGAFYRCNRNTLVNKCLIDHIEYDTNEIITESNNSFVMSNSYMTDEFHDIFIRK